MPDLVTLTPQGLYCLWATFTSTPGARSIAR